MIDTVKFAIPINPRQYQRLREIAMKHHEQFAILKPEQGEFKFCRLRGLAEMDQKSFHREIFWDVPGEYQAGKHDNLIVELSLPKLWYGHNCSLLHNPFPAMELLRKLLNQRLGLKRSPLPNISTWRLKRIDLCFNWKCPSQVAAQAVLDSLKQLHYPRKKPTPHETSLFFGGRTYSIKFYLKLPEFRTNDMEALIKDGASLSWIEHLERKASGILRYEAKLNHQYLKKHEFSKVDDFLKFSTTGIQILNSVEPVSTREEKNDLFERIALHCIEDGSANDFRWGGILKSPEGTARVVYITQAEETLQYFLDKFVGDYKMQLAEEIKAKLRQHYKPIKAARLMSFWLYVRRFGSQDAKQAYGDRNYYYCKSDLKKAGVSLVEHQDELIKLDPGFFQEFKLEVPSRFTSNEYDDFRDGDNLLNFKESAG